MPDILILVAIGIFILRVTYFLVGSIAERRYVCLPTQEALPTVSVIVPARNEEHTIADCISSIVEADYPASLIEIIIVDDRSTDSTFELIDKMTKRYVNVRCIRITNEEEKVLPGKAGALELGICSAKNEIILMTDADCTVPKRWIQTHAQEYVANHSLGMVCGFTLIQGSTLFDKIQAVEWNSTHTMASAAVWFKTYLGCYGNNLSIRKACYFETGGYSSIPFSVTEDLALMLEVSKTSWKIRYICSTENAVYTTAEPTLREYIQQHKRWVIGGRQLGLRAVVFVFTSAILWSAVLYTAFTGQWQWFAIVLSVRLTGDVLLNTPTLVHLKRINLLPYTLLTVIFFMILELILPLVMIDNTVIWKDQVFRANKS